MSGWLLQWRRERRFGKEGGGERWQEGRVDGNRRRSGSIGISGGVAESHGVASYTIERSLL